MLEIIRKILSEKIGNIDFDILPAVDASRGHVSTNAAFVMAGNEGIDIAGAAKILKNHLEKNAPERFIRKIEIANAGFLNIWVTHYTLQDEFERILKAGEKWGKPLGAASLGAARDKRDKRDKWGRRGKPEKVIVEYSQPNIAKPLHIGHLRSTIIGDALANVYEFAGNKVIRWNYLGDWGTQFGKVIAAYKRWGNEEMLKKDPINALNDLYIRFHEHADENSNFEEEGRVEFKKLEDGDKENRKLWARFKKESIKELERAYKLLGVSFDIWIGEAYYEKELPGIIKELEKDGVAVESQGALVVPLDEFNIPPGLIRKSDGATLYLTRDIANLKYRIERYKPDKILYVVDNGQSLHFQQLFGIAGILGMREAELRHVKFGLVLSEDMKKLSTRGGGAISLLEVIEEAIKRAGKIVNEKHPELDKSKKDEIARIVGVGALKYNDLSQNRKQDITFNWDRMLSFEGNSGPYIQYTYVRLRSILRKAGLSAGASKKSRIPKLNKEALEKPSDEALVLKLVAFPGVIEEVVENQFPNYLANYLHDLAREANSYYEREPVLKAEGDERVLRLHLVAQTAIVIKTGLGLLGIEVVEQM